MKPVFQENHISSATSKELLKIAEVDFFCSFRMLNLSLNQMMMNYVREEVWIIFTNNMAFHLSLMQMEE